MKFMLIIIDDEPAQAALSAPDRELMFATVSGIEKDLAARKMLLDSRALRPSSQASTVRMRAGKAIVADGPFAETREQLGGYFLIEAKNLDEAIGVAAKIPTARKGTVEVRPVIEISGLPA